MKRTLIRLISAVLLSALLIALPGGACALTPQGHWFNQYVPEVKNSGLYDAVLSDDFLPDMPITEQDFCNIFYTFFSLPSLEGPAVPSKAPLSRLRAAEIICRELKLWIPNISAEVKDAYIANIADYYEIADEDSREVILTAYINGVMSGHSDGRFAPNDDVTWAEALTMLVNLKNDANGSVPETLFGASPQYTHTLIAEQPGFVDIIESVCKELGVDYTIFVSCYRRPVTELSTGETAILNRVRAALPAPDAETVMQKVISLSDMEKYLSGEYTAPKGFVSRACDVKQYRTYDDCYYGLRLDYEYPEGVYPHQLETGSCGVIRFTAENAASVIIPTSVKNGGTYTDPAPFGGAGFTTGTNGRVGSPEWVFTDWAQLDSGAELYELDRNGNEVLRGVYDARIGRFVEVGAERNRTAA